MLKNREKRFITKHKEKCPGGSILVIVVDTVTGVNYTYIIGSYGASSLSPLLDSNGNVIIDK